MTRHGRTSRARHESAHNGVICFFNRLQSSCPTGGPLCLCHQNGDSTESCAGRKDSGFPQPNCSLSSCLLACNGEQNGSCVLGSGTVTQDTQFLIQGTKDTPSGSHLGKQEAWLRDSPESKEAKEAGKDKLGVQWFSEPSPHLHSGMAHGSHHCF